MATPTCTPPSTASPAWPTPRPSTGEKASTTIGLFCRARAFLAAPPILILDEATAKADAHSELEIQRAITGLAQGRTVVMIAHRLSTIRSADQIVVVDDGRITEAGTHDELLAVGGQYAALWAAQNQTMAGVHDA